MKKVIRILLIFSLLIACRPALADSNNEVLSKDWKTIVQQARGSEVRFYMYGGWAHVNQWIDGFVADAMKTRYDITVTRVPMNAPVFVNKLITEKMAGRKKGVIDLMWINGENFRNAKKSGLLTGPFAHKLPAMALVDPDTVKYDFGFPVEGYEAPYGMAQFVFEHDAKALAQPPDTFVKLAAWVRGNPGRFTYPQPPDFTGSAFLRQVFYHVSGGHEQFMKGFDRKLYEEKAPLAWKYLNDLKPYLWQEGRAYPKDSASLDTLFSRGEVDLNMSYHPIHAQSKVLEGTYKRSVRTFVMQGGGIYNVHFTAIAFNAPNRAGALLLADFLISSEAQLSKYDPKNWGDFPALDLSRLGKRERADFDKVDLGPATLSPATLAGAAVPEIPSEYLEALERDWKKNVLR